MKGKIRKFSPFFPGKRAEGRGGGKIKNFREGERENANCEENGGGEFKGRRGLEEDGEADERRNIARHQPPLLKDADRSNAPQSNPTKKKNYRENEGGGEEN